MFIDEESYKLSHDNYVEIETIKTRIVLANSFNHDMKHVIGWKHRYNGKFKRTAAFTIDAAGSIYKHFDPKYFSRFFNNQEMDRKTIVILLENDGWLQKDTQNNKFITWLGDIYKKPTDVVEKRWRGHDYWSPYTEKQVESASELVRYLCKEFSIPVMAMTHNTKIDNVEEVHGILYRSNIDRQFTDVSPAWDFTGFKHKVETIENYETEH